MWYTCLIKFFKQAMRSAQKWSSNLVPNIYVEFRLVGYIMRHVLRVRTFSWSWWLLDATHEVVEHAHQKESNFFVQFEIVLCETFREITIRISVLSIATRFIIMSFGITGAGSIHEGNKHYRSMQNNY